MFAAGSVLSTVTVSDGIVLPAASSIDTVSSSPSEVDVPETVTLYAPVVASAVVVYSSPFGMVTVTVAPGSVVPSTVVPSERASPLALVYVAVFVGACASTVTVEELLDVLPTASVAVAVIVTPSARVGTGTYSHVPFAEAMTLTVVVVPPLFKLNVTVEPASAVPVTDEPSVFAAIAGADGAVASTVTVLEF